jgi:hypothetical protein
VTGPSSVALAAFVLLIDCWTEYQRREVMRRGVIVSMHFNPFKRVRGLCPDVYLNNVVTELSSFDTKAALDLHNKV